MNQPPSTFHLPPSKSQLKVAIVHDWLVGGGAELVVEQLHLMFPDAPIYTSYCSDEWRKRLDGKVVTGWLQHFGRLRKFMVLGRIWWFTHLNFSGYDLVISSSGNGEAKSIKVPKGTTHICYCHSPTHYYWRHYKQYMKQPSFGALNPLARLGLRLLVGPLRKWDYKAAQRPDYFIANSTHIQKDIRKYYGRDSVVIYPPIDTVRFAAAKPPERRKGFVAHGRQTGYKRIDILVQACNELKLPLTISGKGPEHANLKRLAGPTIKFDFISDEELPDFLAGGEAYLFAAFEDFGVAPVEALAAGTPVIAYRAGGALDYVVPDKTGEFFDEQTVESLKQVLQTFNGKKYSSGDIKKRADEFSAKNFQKNILNVINSTLQ